MADNADDPNDASESNDFDGSDNSEDSEDSLKTSWGSCPGCERLSRARYTRPGQRPKSDEFFPTDITKMIIFAPKRPETLGPLLAQPGEIRFWLIVLIIRMMQINPMILMNVTRAGNCSWRAGWSES